MSTEFEHGFQEVTAKSSEYRQGEERAELYAQCREYVQQPVRLQTKEGGYYEGIIEHVDNEYVYLVTAQDEGLDNRGGESRQFFGYGFPHYGPGFGGYFGPGFGGYFGPGFGGYYGGYPFFGHPFGYGYYGYPRRFGRLVLPLAGLAGVFPYY